MEKLLKKYPIYILFIFIIIVFTSSIILFSYYNKTYTVTKDFTKINLNNIDNLMIIAHPSDESLWGANHLIEDNYLVVCLTCKEDKTTREFINIMNKTNDKYILLGYEEYINEERNNLNKDLPSIKEDLYTIINLKKWSTIVTHNPQGEYGNIHHKIINNIVTEFTPNKDNLYYFPKYYTKKEIINYHNYLLEIDEPNLTIKKNLISIYKSQDYIETMFNHMYIYEDWLTYNEWSEVDEKEN